MRRDQFEHAIRTACQIIGHDAVIVVGSQSILGSYAEDELPVEATMSVEIDILPLGDDGREVARLADLIEGASESPLGRRARTHLAHSKTLRRRPHGASGCVPATNTLAAHGGGVHSRAWNAFMTEVRGGKLDLA